MKSLLLAAAAALLVGGCEVKRAGDAAQPAATVPSGSISEADARKIVDGVHRDFLGGDAVKMMTHYAPGAILFDPSHSQPSADRNTQTQWATEFVAMKPADLVSNPSTVQLLDADTFVASGIAGFTGEVNGHRDLYHARYTQVFERQADGSWLIVHEHMSMPPATAAAAPAAQ